MVKPAACWSSWWMRSLAACQCTRSVPALSTRPARFVARLLTWTSTTMESWPFCQWRTFRSALKPFGLLPATRRLPIHAQAVINMNGVDDNDAFVARVCAKFETLIARFVADCGLVESAEFNHEEVPGVQEARSREQSTIHQWQSLLQQIGRLTAHTNFGARAKLRVLQCCLEHGLAADENVVALVKSLAHDLDRVMHDADCSCRFVFPASSADSAPD